MADDTEPAPENADWNSSEEEYELVPYKEIRELRDELKALRDVPIPNSKRMQVTMEDLSMKMDRLIQIFEHASHEMHAEGGLTPEERIKPMIEKMNKVLEQNSEIAKGIVAVADLIEELRGRMEKGIVQETVSMPQPSMTQPRPQFAPRPLPGGAPSAPAPLPGSMPPPPPKRKLF